MIRIERKPWAAMVSHARQAYPRECCGVMIGAMRDGVKLVCEALPFENAHRGAQRSRYELRPEDLLAADREASVRRMKVIGIYHSHPDADAVFSSVDLQNSCPWYSFVVLSIRNGEFEGACSWQPNAFQSEAEKEEIAFSGSALP